MAPSYTEMTAKMRERPTFAVAEKVLQQDYKLKLPNRTFIQLFNTPEISQFRGYQNELDEAERRRQTLQKEKMEIGTIARGPARRSCRTSTSPTRCSTSSARPPWRSGST